jgi:hypothetical protein
MAVHNHLVAALSRNLIRAISVRATISPLHGVVATQEPGQIHRASPSDDATNQIDAPASKYSVPRLVKRKSINSL